MTLLTQCKQNQIQFFDIDSISVKDDEIVDRYEQEQERIRCERYIKSVIPECYQHKGFDSYICTTRQQKTLLDQMKMLSENIRTGGFYTIVLLGPFGIGKTHLSCALLQDVISRGEKKVYGYDCMMSAQYSLIDEIRERYEQARSFSEKESQKDVIDEYTDCDVLVLDEIGRGTSPAIEKEIIYRIMNQRDMRKRSTVLISNMTMKEFVNYCGGATMDRLKNSAVFPDCSNISSFRGTER